MIMATMVIVLRGKSPQQTVLQVSGLNSLDSSYYVAPGSTIWQDDLNNASQWHLNYQTNTTQVSLGANGALQANATFASEAYSRAVRISRSMNLPLSQSPAIFITLKASVGIHYGIRITGEDSSNTPFNAWSESSYLQHRKGQGEFENFTINPMVEAYKVNGVFPSPGSFITSLLFYMEAGAVQAGEFSLEVSGIRAVSLNQVPFNPTTLVSASMTGIVLNVNLTNSLGYGDNQFFNGYVDYFLSGTPSLTYTVYYLHDLTVLGQGFDYLAGTTRSYQIAVFEINKINSYPPFLAGNNSYSIVLASEQGSFQSFQLSGFSVRYLSQGLSSNPVDPDATAVLAYYIAFLFVTPVVIVVLFSRILSKESKHE